jgi:hypothetical protein
MAEKTMMDRGSHANFSFSLLTIDAGRAAARPCKPAKKIRFFDLLGQLKLK